MKYDDASWPYGGDFPPELPTEAGATHIAMFVAWAALNGLAGDFHMRDAANEFAMLESRDLTPTEWFIRVYDEKFTTEDLTDEGNAFARIYYGSGEGLHSNPRSYLDDYSTMFSEAESLYGVKDSWASFDRLSAKLSARLEAWRNI